MWHDRIFNHLRQRLAFRRTPCWHAERGEMCLQCRFTDLYEYTCHITLIINKGMSQLPVGNQESRASRWAPLGRGVFQWRLMLRSCQSTAYSPLHKGGMRPAAPAAFPQQIFKEGQIGLSSVEQRGHTHRKRGGGGAHLTASRAHAYCSVVCSARDHLYSALKWLIRRLTYSIMWQNL